MIILNKIQDIREKLCNSIMLIYLIVLFPAIIVSLYRITTIGWKPVMALHIILIITLAVFTFFRYKISYTYKAGFILISIFLLGIGGTMQFGLIAAASIAFVLLAPTAVIFFGARIGFIILFFTLITESIIGYLVVEGFIRFDIDMNTYAISASTWLLHIMGVIIGGGTLTLTIYIFNNNLMNALQESNQHEKELKKYQEELEETIDIRTKELQQSNHDLEQFAHTAAHDMRSPVIVISNYAQLLKLRYSESLDQDANKYIKGIVDGVKYANTMIDDLLSFSRINSDHSVYVNAELNTLLLKAEENLSVEISNSGASIAHDILPAVYVNENQIIRVFQNILSNAIKYKAEEQKPTINIEAKRFNGEWEISISDNGMGISSDKYEQIFDIFQRVTSVASSESSGIGLAACKRIIELHGGNIWVESEPGKGSTFYFTLKEEKEYQTDTESKQISIQNMS